MCLAKGRGGRAIDAARNVYLADVETPQERISNVSAMTAGMASVWRWRGYQCRQTNRQEVARRTMVLGNRFVTGVDGT